MRYIHTSTNRLIKTILEFVIVQIAHVNKVFYFNAMLSKESCFGILVWQKMGGNIKPDHVLNKNVEYVEKIFHIFVSIKIQLGEKNQSN